MKIIHLAIIVIAILMFSGINFVFAQTTSSHVMGKFLFSSHTQNLMMRSCGKINDRGDVDPQVMQFVRQNNQNITVSNNNAQQLFWNTLYTKFVSQVPEFKSLGGKNDTMSIEMGGYVALSCPPIQGGNATFQVKGNQLTYKLGFYSDSQAFYYKSIIILHTSQNQTTLMPLPRYCCDKPVTITLNSPLKQFKSGISAQDVICKEGLQLIIKAEDNVPACVKSKSAAVLILHGWASESSNGQIIYFMKSNSTGKLTVKYNSAQSYVQSDLNARIYNGSSMYQIQPSLIEAKVNPSIILGNSNTTVVYTITSHDTKGVYWLSLDVCGFVPIVVNLDDSKITNSDLQPSISGWRCPVSLLQYKIVGFEGIDPQYVRIGK